MSGGSKCDEIRAQLLLTIIPPFRKFFTLKPFLTVNMYYHWINLWYLSTKYNVKVMPFWNFYKVRLGYMFKVHMIMIEYYLNLNLKACTCPSDSKVLFAYSLRRYNFIILPIKLWVFNGYCFHCWIFIFSLT